MTASLAEKLDLVVKALTLSRGRLAADLAVNKSMVSRWLSGAAVPSSHNLTQLTLLVAQRAPGFNLLDWDRDLDALAARLGAAGPLPAATAPATPAPPPAEDGDTSPGRLLVSRNQSRIEVQRLGHAYPGLYLAFRQAFRNAGDMVADLLIFWREGDRLFFRQYDPAFSHTGEVLVLRNQLFCVAEEDHRVDGLMFYVLNGASGQKALRMDGILLSVANDRDRTPSSGPMLLQRLDDLDDPTRPPPVEVLDPIVKRLTDMFVARSVEALAGEAVAAAVTMTREPPGGGPLDYLVRQPVSRGLSASETEWNEDLAADIQRVRREVLGRDDLFPVYGGTIAPSLPR